MRLGNASWGFRETPLEGQLRITADMGLDILELGIANAPTDIPLDISSTQLATVRALFKQYGVDLICAATGNDFTTGTDADVAKVKRVIDICEILGVKYLRIFAGFSPVEDVTGAGWDTMIRCLCEVGEYAQGKVTLAIETHGGVIAHEDGVEHVHSVTTIPETLERLIREIPENIEFLYDPANLWAVGYGNPDKVLPIIGERLALVHLKDFKRLSSGHLVPSFCGESDMNWRMQLRALDSFYGPAMIEYENTEDVADGCRRCLAYIDGIAL